MASSMNFDLELPERVRREKPRLRPILVEAGIFYASVLFGPIAAAAILGFTTVSCVVAGVCVAAAAASALYLFPRLWFLSRFVEAVDSCQRDEIKTRRAVRTEGPETGAQLLSQRYAELGRQLATWRVPRESRQAMAEFLASIDELVQAYGREDKKGFADAADSYAAAYQQVGDSSRLVRQGSEEPDRPGTRLDA